MRDNHAIAPGGQQRRHVDETVNVVRPSMQENDYRAIGWTRFGVANIQLARVDLLECPE